MMLERAWIVECSRCANESSSAEETGEAAAADLRSRGWVDRDGDTYCYLCA